MSALRAALVLSLEDKLSAGLNRFKQQFEGLRDIGKRLGLGKLENGAEVLDKNAQAARGLKKELGGVVGVADRAYAAMKRMGSATFGKEGLGGKVGALGAAVSGYSVVEPIRSYAGFENIARHSAITEGLSGKALEAETRRLMGVFREDALATSQSSESIAQAYQDLIQTGIKPAMAEKLLPIHSRAATAYNISPEALGHAVFALSDSFKIGEGDMGGALAAMAQASKEGRFKVEDFSHFLPSIGGNMSKLGMTGRGSANIAFSALETVMKNSADPSTGATNFTDFMNYLTSPMAARSFSLESRGMAAPTKRLLEQYHVTGIDMPKLLANARTEGVDPISAVLGTLQKKLAGLPPDVVSEILGAFFHNQQARDAALAMLQHSGEFLQMKTQLGSADSGMLGRDFNSANAAPQKQLDLAMEKLAQLGQKAGAAFMPILVGVNVALGGLISLLDHADHLMPGLSDDVLLAVGALLSLGAVTGAVGTVAPAFQAGWALLRRLFTGLLSPLKWLWTALSFVIQGIAALLGGVTAATAAIVAVIVAVVAVIGAAAYDIIAHWDRFAGFFSRMWQGVIDIFSGVLEFLLGVFMLRMDLVTDGLRRIWGGLGEFFGGIWGAAKQLFVDFVATLDGWTGGAVTRAFNAIRDAANFVWTSDKQLFTDFTSLLDGWTGGGIISTFHAIRDAVGSIIDKIHEWIDAMKNGAIGRLLGLSATPAPGAAPPGDQAGPGNAHPARAGVGAAALGDGTFDPTGGSYLLPQSNVRVTVGVDGDGRLIVKNAQSDSPSVKVAAPDINPGATLGRD